MQFPIKNKDIEVKEVDDRVDKEYINLIHRVNIQMCYVNIVLSINNEFSTEVIAILTLKC